MRINEFEKVLGEKCILVPYLKEHVEKYNEWMQDPELLDLTCSESLTLEEEYAMQKSWQISDNKLTFIILDRKTFEQTNNEILAMAGDINGFLIEENLESQPNNELEESIEISLMIAEKKFRGKGLAQEALALMIQYIREKSICKKGSIIVKINHENLQSLKLFKKMHFSQLEYDKIFKSFTYKFDNKKFERIQKNFKMRIYFYNKNL